MAKRYTRVLQLDGASEDTVDSYYDELANVVDGCCDTHFQPGLWQITNGDDHNVLDIVVVKDSFRGQVGVHRAAEVKMIPGQGSEHFFTAKISAECCNLKKQRARQLELGSQHKMAAVVGVMCGLGACVLWTLLQIVALGGIMVGRVLLIYVGVFIFGSAVGGAIGTMVGGKLGKTMGTAVSSSTQNESARFDDALETWEGFIDSLIEVVDDVAANVETTPSKATII